MRWTPKSSDKMPWWLWLLIPLWGPCFALIVVAFAALYYLTLAKRHLVGPSDLWRPWFAWYPVDLPWEDQRAWFEWVERRSGHVLGDAQYRSAPSTPPCKDEGRPSADRGEER